MEGARPRFYDPETKIPGINPPSAGNYLASTTYPSEGDFKGAVKMPQNLAILCRACQEPTHPTRLEDLLCPGCRIDAAKKKHRDKEVKRLARREGA